MQPVGEIRDDYRFSYIASLLTNLAISVNGKKGSKLTSVNDFLFEWDGSKPAKTQSIEEMKNVFQQMAASGRLSGKQEQNKEQRRTRKPISYEK